MKLEHSATIAGLLVISATVLGGQSSTPSMRGVDSKESKSRGEKLYKEQCRSCHFATSTAKKIGPGLKGLTVRGKYADGAKVDDATLKHWIEAGGKDMPGFRDDFSDAQIRDLIAYLRTL